MDDKKLKICGDICELTEKSLAPTLKALESTNLTEKEVTQLFGLVNEIVKEWKNLSLNIACIPPTEFSSYVENKL